MKETKHLLNHSCSGKPLKHLSDSILDFGPCHGQIKRKSVDAIIQYNTLWIKRI